MQLRTLKQTRYQSTTMEEIKKLLQANKHSYLQSLDISHYTITGLNREKYYIKTENPGETRELLSYYEKTTGRKAPVNINEVHITWKQYHN